MVEGSLYLFDNETGKIVLVADRVVDPNLTTSAFGSPKLEMTLLTSEYNGEFIRVHAESTRSEDELQSRG